MGTPACIIVKTESYKTIHLNYDGYPSHALKILKSHYNSQEKAEQLVELGDLSCLGENLWVEGHSFNNPKKGCTIAYHRDRGEELNGVKAQVFDSEIEVKFCNKGYKYMYIWENGKWDFFKR